MAPLAGYSPTTLLSAPKGAILSLRLRAQDHTVTLKKVRGESMQHVLMKGLLWALMLPVYPNARCELDVGHRFRPDVVSLNESGWPMVWGECGAVTASKLRQLADDFPNTHFLVSKWAHSDISGYAEQLRVELALAPRSAPFEVMHVHP